MNPDTDLLAQLRDIQSAPEVPFWPPAPGWWLLTALAMAVLFWGWRRWMAFRAVRKRRRQLLAALESETAVLDPEKQPQDYLSVINRLLKITALRRFPEQACGKLRGQEWSRFLAAHAPDHIDSKVFSVLEAGPYQRRTGFDADALKGAAHAWLRRHG